MSQNNIPVIEVYWSLVDKADKKFSRVSDLPSYGKNSYDLLFHKVFKVYTQLWKFQQENRQKLVETGLKRWEIGEIASRIGQLYYGQYLRTSDATYLSESFIFYEAILSREYFKEGSSQELNLANKQLRCLTRFLIVCLVSNRREMVPQLVNQLRMTVEECKMNFPDSDFRDWKQVVQEVLRFLKVDTAFMNTRPLRYSFVLDPEPDSFPSVASPVSRRLKLREAILCSYHHTEAKFIELTLDTFRMLQCLEWEPSGSFYQRRGPEDGENGSELGPNRSVHLPGITDASLPPNPRKAILYRPAVTHFIAILAVICEELPPNGALLIYLSASGKGGLGRNIPLPSVSGPSANNNIETITDSFQSFDMASGAPSNSSMSSPDSPTNSSVQVKGDTRSNSGGCLWLGSRGNGGLNCIYPCDLIPFTRRPLFLIIDSDNSQTFKAVHGAEMGERAAMLLSPSSPSPAFVPCDQAHFPSGSQFTLFLTAPMQAFCLLLGLPGSNIETEIYNEAEKVLSSSLSNWGLTLATSDSLDPVWAQVLGDPFLRRLLLRFIFCRAVLALYAPTFKQKEFIPECLPHLPESVLPSSPVSQSAILGLANVLDGAHHFVFEDETISAED